MIPLRDDNPRTLFPLVTLLLIIVNGVVFIYEVTLPSRFVEKFFYAFGAVPQVILRGENLHAVFTSMFVHGGVMHLAGNMWYLWLFGDNVEGLTGHWRFFFFYIFCGIVAAFVHAFLEPQSTVPMVGASGAISGVLGAYAVRYPFARVHLLIPIFPVFWLWRVFRVPAILVLGGWFLIQIFNSMSPHSGNVAWFAHIGGFIAGGLFIYFFETEEPPQETEEEEDF